MTGNIPRIYFDKNDYHLLQIVDDVLEKGPRSQSFRSLLAEYTHPQGIKEMAAPRGLRIAYAVVSLLGSFENGLAHDRLRALRTLRDEVFTSSSAYYQKNTARVLLQIMKELVRSRESEVCRLKLAHDFRMVSTGNPRRIRRELAKYHLVEMPEEWNQFAFDDHVHDANTKGRKSPTHLVMDAWIKGIRHLTVVYYNYVRPEVIEELLEAGDLLDVDVQIGIEISSRFRDKYIRFSWEPNSFIDNNAFLKFLEKDGVVEFFEEGREVSQYQQKYVFDVLAIFNERHRVSLNSDLGLDLEPLEQDKFIDFVGTGQPSLLHLARFIHNSLADHIESYRYGLKEGITADRAAEFEKVEKKLYQLNVETLIAEYLHPARNPEIHDPTIPLDDHELPRLLKSDLHEVLTRLISLHSSSRFTLNLGNLSAQDTLEILYAGGGMFTHIEAYNLKDASRGMSAGFTVGNNRVKAEAVQLKNPEAHYSLIGRLQRALNDDNVINLKNAIREIILDHDDQQVRLRNRVQNIPADKDESVALADELQQMRERKLDLIDILSGLEAFHNSYRKRSLKSRIGSGSTGQAEHQYGMGFVVLDTLPARGRRAFSRHKGGERRTLIPVSAMMTKNT